MPTEKKEKKSTHTFMIEMEGIDGEWYSGKVTTKRLTIKDIQTMGVLKTNLNGGYHVVVDEFGNPTGKGIDPATDSINEMWSHCAVALIQKPQWFDRETLCDGTVLSAVWKEVLRFEDSFRIKREDAGGSEEGSEEQSEGGGGSPEIPPEVVDKEVPKITKKRRVQ